MFSQEMRDDPMKSLGNNRVNVQVVSKGSSSG